MITKFLNNEHLTPLLSRINKEEKICVLMGDFNINLLRNDTKPEVSKFFDNLLSHFFAPYIFQPTKFAKNSKTLIDNIFINTVEFGSYSGNFMSQISGHLQFVMHKDFLRKPPSTQNDSFKHNYKFFNNDEFKNDLKNIPWQNIVSENNVSASIAFDIFSTRLVLKLHTHVKYLGIFIDEVLSCNKQIDILSSKLSRVNGILSKLCHFAPLKACLWVYYSMFYSHMLHGSLVWFYTEEINFVWVNKLQKCCIGILTLSDFNSHTIDLFTKLKMLKVQVVFTLNKCIFMFDYIKGCIPDELKRLFTFSYDIHSYITHSSEAFHISNINTA